MGGSELEDKGISKRRAVLVIHGIGQQRKYQTLSEFTMGLIRLGLPAGYGIKGREIVKELSGMFAQSGIELFDHGPVRLKGGMQVGLDVYKTDDSYDTRVTMDVPKGASKADLLEVDIYESYWAQFTCGRTNILKVISWLIIMAFRSVSNVFAPRDPISLNPRYKLSRSGGFFKVAKEFLRELGRFLMVLIILFLVVWGLCYAVVEIIRPFYNNAGDYGNLLKPMFVSMTLFSLLWLFIAIQFIVRLFTGGLRIHWTMIILLTIMLAAAGIALYIVTALVRIWILQLALAIFLLTFIQKWFVEYLGDVEVYTSASDSGVNRDVRAKIIGEAQCKLETILKRTNAQTTGSGDDVPYYDDVIIIGHSLGSVIAYDVLCRVLRHEGGPPAADARRRVTQLYTVGSPLDKIWYFFRDRSQVDNPLYQGILGKLKGVKASGMTNSPLSDINWTNIWVFTDIVSGGLGEYGDLVENIHLNSMLLPPFVNHVQYWASGNVMKRLGERIFL